MDSGAFSNLSGFEFDPTSVETQDEVSMVETGLAGEQSQPHGMRPGARNRFMGAEEATVPVDFTEPLGAGAMALPTEAMVPATPATTVSSAAFQSSPVADEYYESVSVGSKKDGTSGELSCLLSRGTDGFHLTCPIFSCGMKFRAKALKDAKSNFRRHWRACHVGSLWYCTKCKKTAQRSDNLRGCCMQSSSGNRKQFFDPGAALAYALKPKIARRPRGPPRPKR